MILGITCLKQLEHCRSGEGGGGATRTQTEFYNTLFPQQSNQPVAYLFPEKSLFPEGYTLLHLITLNISPYLQINKTLNTFHKIYHSQIREHVCFLLRPKPNCPKHMSGLAHVTERAVSSTQQRSRSLGNPGLHRSLEVTRSNQTNTTGEEWLQRYIVRFPCWSTFHIN